MKVDLMILEVIFNGFPINDIPSKKTYLSPIKLPNIYFQTTNPVSVISAKKS